MDPAALVIPFGEAALVLALVLLLMDLLLLWTRRGITATRTRWALAAPVSGCLLVIASYLILTLAFLADAFQVREVYSSSSSGLALIYKIGNPWIGGPGSLLFFTALLAGITLVFRLGRAGGRDPAVRAASMILDGFLAAFVLVILLRSPFLAWAGMPVEGIGLNPLLQTVWVLSHPPVIFAGYALVLFAAALTLAGAVAAGEPPDAFGVTVRRSLLAAWLCLTLGIALGGWWSYRVLGWGGYWAWDPVETASLLPWLALAAAFHVPAGRRTPARDLMVIITAGTVFFATALTRGGYAQSVHAFGESPVGAALFIAGALLVVAYLWVARRQLSTPGTFSFETRSAAGLFRMVAFGSLLLLLAICFLGLVVPLTAGLLLQRPFSLDPGWFTLACYPVVLVLVTALVGCRSWVSLRVFASLVAVAAVAGLALALAGLPTPVPAANAGIPLLVIALAVLAADLARYLARGRPSIHATGSTLVHLAVPLILIGVVLSSAGAWESVVIPAQPGSSTMSDGMVISLQDPVITIAAGRVYYPSHRITGPEYSDLRIPVTVDRAGDRQGGLLRLSYYPVHGTVSEPLILSTPTEDLHIILADTNATHQSLFRALVGERVIPGDVNLTVRRVPFAGLIWAGIVLMCSGILLVLFQALRHPPGKNGYNPGE
jgi:cytochrome c-type biogenesis protein CcmF